MGEELPDVLQRILARKRERLEEAMERVPLSLLVSVLESKTAERTPSGCRSLTDAMGRKGSINIIGEMKKRSPSRGIIRESFDILELCRAYEQGGVDAFSVLTEEDYFLGSLDFIRRIRPTTDKPILRKDFLFDPYQIYEAREAGADAVLLIAAVLEGKKMEELIALSRSLGMDSLVEVHSREELARVLDAGAELIGINNRDLHTFEVRLETAIELIREVPDTCVVVSESGIRGPADLARLLRGGINSFLIGEHFMKAADIPQAVRELKGVSP